MWWTRPNMIDPRRTATLISGLVLFGLLAGCSGQQPELAEVRGKVTLNGAPLKDVMVVFYPDTEVNARGQVFRGKTDATGAYTLTTATGQPGAMVGKYRVIVQVPTPERPPNWEKSTTPTPKVVAIPLKYTVVSDTPLRVEIKPGGSQTIDLPLQP